MKNLDQECVMFGDFFRNVYHYQKQSVYYLRLHGKLLRTARACFGSTDSYLRVRFRILETPNPKGLAGLAHKTCNFLAISIKFIRQSIPQALRCCRLLVYIISTVHYNWFELRRCEDIHLAARRAPVTCQWLHSVSSTLVVVLWACPTKLGETENARPEKFSDLRPFC